MGVILVIGIITLFVIVLWRTRKRRERVAAFLRHIQTLNDAWQISWQEIRLLDEIGGGASGRVWKAQYRDMDVAVKMLMLDDDPQSSLEFVREINLGKQYVIQILYFLSELVQRVRKHNRFLSSSLRIEVQTSRTG